MAHVNSGPVNRSACTPRSMLRKSLSHKEARAGIEPANSGFAGTGSREQHGTARAVIARNGHSQSVTRRVLLVGRATLFQVNSRQ
jgi:hypothetical protein